jgi:ABC-2 type transport system permease protein
MRSFAVMRKVLITEFQFQTLKRVDVLIGFLFLWVPIVLNVFLWQSVYELDPGANMKLGYSLYQLTSYFIIVLICERLLSTHIHSTLNQQILDSSLNPFLLRPSSHFLFHFMRHVGEKSSRFIYFVLPGIILYIVFRNSLIVPSLQDGLYFVITICFSFMINFLLYYALGMLGFWFGKAGQIMTFITGFIMLFDGSKFPVDFMPTWLVQFVSYLPFQYIYYFPAKVLIGTETTNSFLSGLLVQAIWVVILGVICNFCWRKGLSRYGAFGG